MRVVHTREELREFTGKKRREEICQGFVPTMGALHEGHLALMQRSVAECDYTTVSIFINPAQFNDPGDLERYPMTPERDLELCEKVGVDLVFMPSRPEMYPEGEAKTNISIPELTETLCAPGRPGHFEGVLLVVSRLFNLFEPCRAYFGRKDYQQFSLIRLLARELDFPVEVVGHPTVRDADGLALSSRNALLADKDREHARLIYRALKLGRQAYLDRDTTPEEIAEIVEDVIGSGSRNRVEYVDIVDCETLKRLESFEGVERFLIGVAAFCGSVRLIDNLEVPDVLE